MGQPYIGEIRIFAGNFAPAGWMFCDGATMAISENDTLFNLIGTTYGGDGQSTFNLPDLRGRIPIHQGTDTSGNSYNLADAAGVETVTLTVNQVPVHTHGLLASTDIASTPNPQGNTVAKVTTMRAYGRNTSTLVPLAPGVVGTDGGSQPHSNMMPYLGINFIISLFGIYPSPT